MACVHGDAREGMKGRQHRKVAGWLVSGQFPVCESFFARRCNFGLVGVKYYVYLVKGEGPSEAL